jgi:Gpi18-like mannosyltransferase
MLTAAVLVLLVAFAYGRREYFIKNENLLLLGLFMAFSCCMFLPGMHERYDYGIVLIMTVFCFGLRRKLLPVAIIMNMTCLLTYIIVLFAQYDMSIKLISAVQVFAYFYLGYMLITDRS